MIAPAYARYRAALARATTGTTRPRTNPTPHVLAGLALAVPAACAAPGWAPVTTTVVAVACWAWWRFTNRGANR